jgi:hypothetical protein
VPKAAQKDKGFSPCLVPVCLIFRYCAFTRHCLKSKLIFLDLSAGVEVPAYHC